MKNCSSCRFYGAIDPSAGNCRQGGSTRLALRATTPISTCSRFEEVANDNEARTGRTAI